MSETEAATEAPESPAPEAAPAPEPSLSETLASAYDKAQGADDSPREGPARDDAGRFASKEKPQEAPAEAAEPEDPAIATAPQSWDAQKRELWGKLPADVRKYIADREGETHKRISELGSEVAKLKPLEQVIAPYRQAFALSGLPEHVVMQQLLETQQLLQRDPVNGLRWVAQQLGVPVEHLAAAAPQAPQDPHVQALMSEVQQLKAATQAQQEQARAAMEAGLSAEIQSFAKERPHFEAVRAEMGRLIQAGAATDLADAYDKAVWATPSTRDLMLAEQRKAAVEAQEQARKAEAAKRAATVNVRGASAPGATAAPRTIRESLSAAYDRSVGA